MCVSKYLKIGKLLNLIWSGSIGLHSWSHLNSSKNSILGHKTFLAHDHARRSCCFYLHNKWAFTAMTRTQQASLTVQHCSLSVILHTAGFIHLLFLFDQKPLQSTFNLLFPSFLSSKPAHSINLLVYFAFWCNKLLQAFLLVGLMMKGKLTSFFILFTNIILIHSFY